MVRSEHWDYQRGLCDSSDLPLLLDQTRDHTSLILVTSEGLRKINEKLELFIPADDVESEFATIARDNDQADTALSEVNGQISQLVRAPSTTISTTPQLRSSVSSTA